MLPLGVDGKVEKIVGMGEVFVEEVGDVETLKDGIEVGNLKSGLNVGTGDTIGAAIGTFVPGEMVQPQAEDGLNPQLQQHSPPCQKIKNKDSK